MKKAIDLSGRRFNKFTVLERVSKVGEVPVMWRCRCDCGKIVDRPSQHLRNLRSYSCGCVRRPRAYTEKKHLPKSDPVTYFGQTRQLSDWCRILNLPYQRTYARLKNGWGVKRAFDGKSPYGS